MDPRPRDFTVGTFKCRSTPTGTLPLEHDVFDTIGRGFYASSMPSWKALTAQERADLLAYVKDFCPLARPSTKRRRWPKMWWWDPMVVWRMW
jgi:hypothetical protein